MVSPCACVCVCGRVFAELEQWLVCLKKTNSLQNKNDIYLMSQAAKIFDVRL